MESMDQHKMYGLWDVSTDIAAQSFWSDRCGAGLFSSFLCLDFSRRFTPAKVTSLHCLPQRRQVLLYNIVLKGDEYVRICFISSIVSSFLKKMHWKKFSRDSGHFRNFFWSSMCLPGGDSHLHKSCFNNQRSSVSLLEFFLWSLLFFCQLTFPINRHQPKNPGFHIHEIFAALHPSQNRQNQAARCAKAACILMAAVDNKQSGVFNHIKAQCKAF